MRFLLTTTEDNITSINRSDGVRKYNLVASEDGNTENAPNAPRLAFSKYSSWNWQPFLIASSIFGNVLLVLLLGWLWHSGALLSAFSESCHLPTDKLWGRPIPWRKVVLENDPVYIDSDPFDGRWNEDKDYKPALANGVEVFGPWDDLYIGAWVGFDDPSKAGVDGGLSLVEHGSKIDSNWTPTSRAFGVAIMHQLHCVGWTKHVINDYRRTGNSTKPWLHTDHCLEVLRQAIICHGDMTLQEPDVPPANGGLHWGISNWGNTHLCRDWDAVQEAIWDHSIVWSNKGKGFKHRPRIDTNED